MWQMRGTSLRTAGTASKVQNVGGKTGSSPPKGFHNVEKFQIKYDAKSGDPVEIIVHRKVEPNEFV